MERGPLKRMVARFVVATTLVTADVRRINERVGTVVRRETSRVAVVSVVLVHGRR